MERYRLLTSSDHYSHLQLTEIQSILASQLHEVFHWRIYANRQQQQSTYACSSPKI